MSTCPSHPSPRPSQHPPRETVREVAAKAAVRLVLSPYLWTAIIWVVVFIATGVPPGW